MRRKTNLKNKPTDLPIHKPEMAEDKPVWFPLVRVARTVPFGYREDPDDDMILLPVEEELFLLEVAKEYLESYSYRIVANWLSEESGRYISHVGLRKRLEQERKRRQAAGRTAAFRKKYEEALEKEERLTKNRVGGVKTRRIPDSYSFAREYAKRKEASTS